MNKTETIHAEIDRVIAAAAASPKFRRVTCRRGCSWCCSEPLQVTRQEAELILANIPADKRAAVTERAKVWADRAEAAPHLMADALPKAVDYLRARLVCPLLENGECLVYSHRPAGCRMHNAIGDPVLCSTPETRPLQRYSSVLGLTEWVGRQVIDDTIELNHLGAYLAWFLAGRDVETKAAQKIILVP